MSLHHFCRLSSLRDAHAETQVRVRRHRLDGVATPDHRQPRRLGAAAAALATTFTMFGADGALAEDDAQLTGYELERIDPGEARGTSLWAVPTPGETYEELSGTVGHRTDDMVLEDGGPLSFAARRQFEEVPAAYPFEFGTMSLRIPQLRFVDVHFEAANDPMSFDCSTWDLEEGTGIRNAIEFVHEDGSEQLIFQKEMSPSAAQLYPDWASHASNNHWLLTCQNRVIRVHSPSGTEYRFDLTLPAGTRAVESRDADNLFTDAKGTVRTDSATGFIVYATEQRRLDATLRYTYAQAPETTVGGTSVRHREYPPRSSPQRIMGSYNSRGVSYNSRIHRKMRLTSVSLERAGKSRSLRINYRSAGAACPGLVSSITSDKTRARTVVYKYMSVAQIDNYVDDFNESRRNPYSECVLAKVIRDDKSSWQFTYGMSDTESFLTSIELDSDDRMFTTYAYLPLRTVTTPTGAQVTYNYRVLDTCEYQDTVIRNSTHERNCKHRRPAVKSRSVRGEDIPTHYSGIHYTVDRNRYEVSRRITNGNFAHKLTFHRIDRVSNPFSDPDRTSGIGRALDESGRLRLYERLSGTSATASTTLSVQYLYEHGVQFTKPRTWYTAGSPRRNWQAANADLAYAYGARNVHVRRQVSILDNRRSETRYDARDDYGNPTTFTEMFGGGGAAEISRVTNRTYDNGLRGGQPGWGHHQWTVSLLTQEIVASGETKPYKKHWTYDRHARLVETNENMSRRLYDYGSDGVDNPRSDPVSVTDGVGRRTRFVSYKHGIPTTTINPDGGMPWKSVDDLGNVTFESLGNTVTVSRGFGNTFGRLGREVPGGGRAGTTYTPALWDATAGSDRRRIDKAEVDDLMTSYTHYDVLGRVLYTRTEPHGWNGPRRRQRLQYNLVGRVVRASDIASYVPSNTGSSSFRGMKYTYDTLGRVLSEKHTSEDGVNGGIRYCYGRACDASADMALAAAAPYVRYGFARADQDNNWTVHNFRAIGGLGNAELVEIIQWVGTNAHSDPRAAPIVRTTIDRNLVGFVKAIEQSGVGGSFAPVRRSYTPYANGDSTTMLLGSEKWLDFKKGNSAMTRTVTNRDAEGRPVRERRFDGSEFMRMYDAMGRVTNVEGIGENDQPFRDAAALGYSYYQNGALKSASTDGGRTTWEYTYDRGSGDLANEKLTVDPGSNEANLIFEIGYDNGPLGLPTRITYPSGREIDIERNAYGQVKKIPGYVTGAGYRPSGALASYALANETSFRMIEDARQRPRSWDVTSGASNEDPVLDMTYGYNYRGHVQSIDNYFPDQDASLAAAKYDGLGRLWSVDGPWGNAWYAYSNTGDLTFRGIGGQEMEYQYTGEKLTATSSVHWTEVNHPVVHDGNGNVARALGANFGFDRDNRLKTTFRNGIYQSNAYDAHGRRVRSSTNSMWREAPFEHRTFYVYGIDGTLLHEHDRETGEMRDHIQLAGRTIATVERHDDFDTDLDGLPDWYERRHGLLAHDPDDAWGDADGDGFTNLEEYEQGSSPSRGDTDGDGIADRYDPDYAPPSDDEPGSGNDPSPGSPPGGGTGGAGPGNGTVTWLLVH